MRNVEDPKTGTSIGVSDTGSWRSQESRLFFTRVPKSQNVKCRRSRNRHINQTFGYQELEESRVKTLLHKSPKIAKCKTPKHLFGIGFRYQELDCRNTSSQGMQEYRNVKCMFRIGPWSMVTSSKRYREELEETSSISEFEAWRVEMTHHRILRMRKCKIHF
jgi:hypothetical protein